jgi:hypothetical protein
MSKGKFRKPAYALLGIACFALGLQWIITGEYSTDSGPIRRGMSLTGPPAVMTGIAVRRTHVSLTSFAAGDQHARTTPS